MSSPVWHPRSLPYIASWQSVSLQSVCVASALGCWQPMLVSARRLTLWTEMYSRDYISDYEDTSLSLAGLPCLAVFLRDRAETEAEFLRFVASPNLWLPMAWRSNDLVFRETGLRQATCIVREHQVRFYVMWCDTPRRIRSPPGKHRTGRRQYIYGARVLHDIVVFSFHVGILSLQVKVFRSGEFVPVLAPTLVVRVRTEGARRYRKREMDGHHASLCIRTSSWMFSLKHCWG